jgi:hypothetical protein
MNIIKKHGDVGLPASASETVKSVVDTWAWLLPPNGTFTLGELAEDIRATYDASNPRTAHDLLVLEAAERGLKEPKAWREKATGKWLVSGFRGGELVLYHPLGKKWEELTVEVTVEVTG